MVALHKHPSHMLLNPHHPRALETPQDDLASQALFARREERYVG
ncbi:hypothetical protein BSU04_37090 [Caballeronia sordidicola]|uniref:Uncharacterized protein n=1 Tax=Caballeronia sordidicola TaxID=196367 RepID=A0A226WQE3_CABSO|nr:hypothetical protein BSU04_37090 [Caballeronia sordidicola]